MPRKKPTLDRLALFSKIPENKLKRPSSPEEARQWLERAALHLTTFHNAGPSLQFVGCALLQYLKGNNGNGTRGFAMR